MSQNLPDRCLSVFSWACALLLTTGVCIIIGFLILNGWRSLNWDLIFADTRPWDAILLKRQVFGGLFPAMAGTFMLIILSVGIALPLGLCAGIYLAEYASSSARLVFGFMVDLLAGIPSIVVGLFGFSITIFLHHFYNSRIYPCLLVSAFSLAFLVL
ncbi:MAG: phosphate ABC transporter permease, partial [Desulfobacterales bacterium]|nr:phosphate ABC transporter permease [Desulfobacterales bacterium]